MRRSEINKTLEWAKQLLNENNVYLPPFGHWTIDDWNTKEKRDTLH